MATISRSQLRQDIQGILKGADLTQLSAKKVRRKLEEIHDTELTDRKEEIDELLMAAMKEQEEEEEESEEEEENGGKEDDSASKSGSDFEEPEDMGPPKKKAKVAHKKPDKKKEAAAASDSDENDVDDAKLAEQLQAEENRSGRRTRFFKSSKPTPSSQKKSKAAKSPKTGKSKTGYAQPCQLSPQLAALMETDEMARSDVVKKMWEIIKGRELLDPRNKQFMICDEELQKIFGRKRVRTFGMMKYLKDHIFKPGELDDMVI